MIEHISLQIFWTFMILCAATFLSAIWIPFEEDVFWIPLRMQLVITFFVIGLAAALVWLPLVVYRFLQRLP